MVEKCSICMKEFEVDEDGDVIEEDEDGNPLIFYCSECDHGQENMLCGDCVTNFTNAVVDICKNCLKVTEKVVEKIVEKPIYIERATEGIGKEETMEDFEKRILEL